MVILKTLKCGNIILLLSQLRFAVVIGLQMPRPVAGRSSLAHPIAYADRVICLFFFFSFFHRSLS